MKLKTSWHFTKWDGLNIVFVIHYSRCFKKFWGSANILLHIPLKIQKKMKKILSPVYSLMLKNIILFLTLGLIFVFSNDNMHNVVLTLPSVVKIYVENDNVVFTLSNVVQINVEIDKVDSTLFNVVNFSVDVHNFVSTLIWQCTTSWRHINLKTMLKWRWNVCCDNMPWPTEEYQ